MATNKRTTQANKASSGAKGKTSAAKAASGGKKTTASAMAAGENRVPVRLVSSVICIALFILFLVMSIKAEGALLKIIYSIVLGLIGKTAFYVSIPALLYLFIIQAFSAGKPVKMRSICLIAFVLICGCISGLILNTDNLSSGIALLGDLYKGGAEGYTGGVICGGLAKILIWALGTVIPYVVLIIAAVFTLLASLQITIPSLIRAVRNRPRPEWDENAVEERPEPAALVVNHIATKHIEYTQKKKERIRQQEELLPEPPVSKKKPKSQEERTITPKASDLMNQIDVEIGTPVSAAAEYVDDSPVVVHEQDKMMPPQSNLEQIPDRMPEFVPDAPLVTAPKTVKVVPVVKPDKVTAKEAAESAQQVAQEVAQAQAEKKPAYCFPPVDLLNLPVRSGGNGTEEMRENTRLLNETLDSFKIDAHIVNVTRGPSVTRYEVELDKGVRLNKLTSCAKDIALSLGVSGVRIEAVPNKNSIVGIEVPNKVVHTVSLREVIDSPEFARSKSKSSFSVGKDIGGSCIVGNIAAMPHMLIAGTTGSGKSVCMNCLIISLLYKAGPEDVKLIMVDPKMVELGMYNDIPHLLIPVITDPKKAAGSLQWAVTEMLRRYQMMSDAGVRDLTGYNNAIQSGEVDGEKLPQIVIVIDELADLMFVAAKEVEDSICRIAQMGRASGLHLVIATQRPSADVITGLMKANIPARIAFQVSSAMESRIILDDQGAEKLVGRGDMIYAPKVKERHRVQGCFVSDKEVESVTSYIKNNYVSEYDQQIIADIEKKAAQHDKEEKKDKKSDVESDLSDIYDNPMLPQAVEVFLETGQGSVSMLQRRLKLGYAHAARIVDEMEEKGFVGPFKGSKSRDILITREEWAAIKGEAPQQLSIEEMEEPPFDQE